MKGKQDGKKKESKEKWTGKRKTEIKKKMKGKMTEINMTGKSKDKIIIREIFILIVSGIPAVWTLLRKQLDFEDS